VLRERYSLPVTGGRVLVAFRAPATYYGPGHRGVDLAADDGSPVGAAGAGVVQFAGLVAGRGVIVIVHPDGVSTEYEPVRPAVGAGASVSAGQQIATVDGHHPACAPQRCLHWGARRGRTYFDPLSLIGALGPVRLIP
jgi:murein DD-endopeptidase MepM/ murein hydrolase activator NlpD